MKLSKEFKDRIEESGIDPLQFILNIMEGKEFDVPHPFLETFNTFIECLTELGIQDPSFTNIITNFHEAAFKALSRGYVPIELRARAGLELMQYCYPKRRSIELAATPEQKRKEVESQLEKYNTLFDDVIN